MDQELYHHGVKGQKWGVIRYRRELNKNEQRMAQNKYDLIKNANKIDWQQKKYESKQTAKNKSKLDSLQNDRRKLIASYEKGNKVTNDLMDRARKQGYKISEAQTQRQVYKGKNIVTSILTGSVALMPSTLYGVTNVAKKDARTLKKHGIEVQRDDQQRITGMRSKDASMKQIRRINKMQRKILRTGDY